MATTLLDSLQGLVTPELLSLASSKLGESDASVSKGLGAAIPLILGAMMEKSNDTSAVSQIMSLLNRGASQADVIGNLRGVVSGDASHSAATALGSDLLSALFGKQLGSVTAALGGHAGLKSSSANSIMTIAATLVATTLGDKVRREGLGSTGLLSLIRGQRDGILGALPAVLAGAGGLGALRHIGDTASGAARDMERRSAGFGWLPWAAVAALLLLVGGFALMRSGVRAPDVSGVAADAPKKIADAARPIGQAASQAGQAAGDAARVVVASLGDFTTRQLPANIQLSVPERGVESQLIAYLADPNKPLEPPLWFNFDRLLFETGSATLKPESREQLKNVAEIMRAYPTVKLKIGGYTDNVGDPQSNLKLSQDRAASVVAMIVSLGITPDRLSAEGYGEQFPVADNSTDQGRQQNRRIAMRVTAK